MGWALASVVVAVTLTLLVSWLGGGRKWAFRTMLLLLVLGLLTGATVVGYVYWTEKSAEHQRAKIHQCAIDKIARAKCEQFPTATSTSSATSSDKKSKTDEHGPWEKYQKDAPKEIGFEVCPPYMLTDNPTPEQESDAMTAAEKVCWAEASPKQKSVTEQVTEYRQEHGIKEVANPKPRGDIFDQLVSECAAKVRKDYPGAYDDLDDQTLTKKVLAKYPRYCEPNSGDPPGWKPVIEGIR
jgi:hypothetical protein